MTRSYLYRMVKLADVQISADKSICASQLVSGMQIAMRRLCSHLLDGQAPGSWKATPSIPSSNNLWMRPDHPDPRNYYQRYQCFNCWLAGESCWGKFPWMPSRVDRDDLPFATKRCAKSPKEGLIQLHLTLN
ncbi:hypothetical protein J6590_023663 [Homalodisca vitripennis]|nr:hypothetical protein J6590_023663 [Homalodisca vitripennis]